MSDFPISPIPLPLVHRIAAGEVLDSWEAVVRELVENSLDAQTTHLYLSLWPEAWRLRLADNGTGMSREDLLQAALPHHTSKLSLWNGENALDSITTLGFRGEALHSLAQLAQLEIWSRAVPQVAPQVAPEVTAEITAEFDEHPVNKHPEDQGWRVTYNTQGQPLDCEPVAMAPGTIVWVSHLFAPWASRRQALLPLKKSLRSLQTVLHHLALTHPQVTWQIEQNDRLWFNLRPTESPRGLIPQILPSVHLTDLVEQTSAQIDLVLGLPSHCHRRRPDWIKVAINQRVVHCPELEQVILASFHRTLPRDSRSTTHRFPLAFVHFHLPPALVDWNRHPSKTEVYLQNLTHWQELLRETIAQTLALPEERVGETYANQRVDRLLQVAEKRQGYGFPSPERLEKREISPHPFSPLKAIGQLHQMYIVAESPTGLCLVEQHIAHERVLYEQLQDRWQLETLTSPMILSHLTLNQIEQLQSLGIDCDPFGERQWIIRMAPAPLCDRPDCAEAIMELSLGGDLDAAQVATACRTALRNGTPLTLSEMQNLLDQWQNTRQPHTCPHGRPICLKLDETSLSRFFRRHWVVGKSHGAFPL